jgi:hypothetical protein
MRHHRRIPILLLSLGLTFISAPEALAVHTLRLSLEKLTATAADIYVATVLSAAPLLDRDTNAVWTEYLLRIDETWKGARITTRRLRFFGGETEGRSEGIAGQPTLDVGSRYLLFVGSVDRNFAPTVGVGQGIFRIIPVADERGGADTIELISVDGERLEIDGDHKIARTGQWALVGGVPIKAHLVEPQDARKESDPDPLRSTGRPSANRAVALSAPSLRPATLDEVRRWLVDPVLAQSRSAGEH